MNLGTVKVLLPARCSARCRYHLPVAGDFATCSARDTRSDRTAGDLAPGNGEPCIHIGLDIVKVADSDAPAFTAPRAPAGHDV